MTDDAARYRSPSFAEVARSLGVEAETINSLSDRVALRTRLADLRGPLLLDGRLTTEVRGDWLDFHYRRERR